MCNNNIPCIISAIALAVGCILLVEGRLAAIDDPDYNACQPGSIPDTAGNCIAFCGSDCPAHSTCAAPNVCQCNLGYIAVPQERGELACQTVCNEAYIWSDAHRGCVPRCAFANITWDAVHKACVQRLLAEVKIVAFNRYVDAIREDFAKSSQYETSSVGSVTDAVDASELIPVVRLDFLVIIVTLTLLAILLASILWRFYIKQQDLVYTNVDAYEGKIIVYEENELDRSQIMVY